MNTPHVFTLYTLHQFTHIKVLAAHWHTGDAAAGLKALHRDTAGKWAWEKTLKPKRSKNTPAAPAKWDRRIKLQTRTWSQITEKASGQRSLGWQQLIHSRTWSQQRVRFQFTQWICSKHWRTMCQNPNVY